MKIRYGTLPIAAGVAVFDQHGAEYSRVAWNQVAAHYDARDKLCRVENAQPIDMPMATDSWPEPITHMKVYLPLHGVELVWLMLTNATLLLPGAAMVFHPGSVVVQGAAAVALLGGYIHHPRGGERAIDVPAPRLVLP